MVVTRSTHCSQSSTIAIVDIFLHGVQGRDGRRVADHAAEPPAGHAEGLGDAEESVCEEA